MITTFLVEHPWVTTLGLVASVVLGPALLVLLGATATSAMIELLQAVVPALGRSCSTNDWLSNTVGAVTAAALAGLVLAVRPPSGTAAR